MTGNLVSLFVAMFGFVGGHFLLSAPFVRGPMVAKIGERAFHGVYSAVVAVFLIWALFAYGAAPRLPLWDFGPIGLYVPLVVMPFSLMLVVTGLTSRNVTAIGGDRGATQASSVKGIVTVTRHPFLWGAALWALAHLVANGNSAALILFGGIAILSLGGMAAIDSKRAAKLGKDWAAIRVATSPIPFGAKLAGRASVDWVGIGWTRPLIGLLVYVVLLIAHRWIFGVPAF